jgi:hypothetical protein
MYDMRNVRRRGPELGKHSVTAHPIARDDHEPRAQLGEPQRPDLSDTGRRSGNDDDFALNDQLAGSQDVPTHADR